MWRGQDVSALLQRHTVRDAEIEFGDSGLPRTDEVSPARVPANEESLEDTGPSVRVTTAASEVFRKPDTPSDEEAERVRQFILALDENKKRQKQDDELRIPANAPRRPRTQDEIAADLERVQRNEERRRSDGSTGTSRISPSAPHLTSLERSILDWAERRGMTVGAVRMHTQELTQFLRNAKHQRGQDGSGLITFDEVERVVNGLCRKLHHPGI